MTTGTGKTPPLRGAVADNHAMIITDSGPVSPSGQLLYAKTVDSIDSLLKALLWRRASLRPAKLPAQVWILSGAGERLGWGPEAVDPEEGEPIEDIISRLDAVTDRLFAEFLEDDDTADGWHLFRPAGESGWRIHLLHRSNGGRDRFLVDLLLEGWMSLASRAAAPILGTESNGDFIDFDDDRQVGAELGRRLCWYIDHLKVLPGTTSARTGAAMADRTWDTRKKNAAATKKKASAKPAGPYPAKAAPLPPIEDATSPDDIEPEVRWARPIDLDDFGKTDVRLVTIDQRASYLASAGMVSLGLGPMQYFTGQDAEDLANNDPLPFGIWRVCLPALNSLNVPTLLPPPHPRMRPDVDTDAWITTETLRSLSAAITSGGAGLSVWDLDIREAWVTTEQGLALKTWKEDLAAARAAALAAGDATMKRTVSDIYKGYLGRIANPDLWRGKLEHHHQPLWRASIIAHARHRSRAKAAAVAAEHQIWPIKAHTDSWTYLVSETVQLADDAPGPDGKIGRAGLYLGKFTTESDITLDESGLLRLLETRTAADVRHAVEALEDGAGAVVVQEGA